MWQFRSYFICDKIQESGYGREAVQNSHHSHVSREVGVLGFVCCKAVTLLLLSYQQPSAYPVISFHNVWYVHNTKYRLNCRSQWPRDLRRRSSVARLLRLWVRIPPGHGCLSVVSVMCCQVDASATDWSPVQRSPTDSGASLSVIKKPRKRGDLSPMPGCENTTAMGCNARKTNKQTNRLN